mmetsp:Transcript_30534/g.87566  ORF Transcript_30534/g.87566 Transcript_30534/m.87566 type:complete len:255 (+) Transcript_30534:787-1551(+)
MARAQRLRLHAHGLVVQIHRLGRVALQVVCRAQVAADLGCHQFGDTLCRGAADLELPRGLLHPLECLLQVALAGPSLADVRQEQDRLVQVSVLHRDAVGPGVLANRLLDLALLQLNVPEGVEHTNAVLGLVASAGCERRRQQQGRAGEVAEMHLHEAQVLQGDGLVGGAGRELRSLLVVLRGLLVAAPVPEDVAHGRVQGPPGLHIAGRHLPELPREDVHGAGLHLGLLSAHPGGGGLLPIGQHHDAQRGQGQP